MSSTIVEKTLVDDILWYRSIVKFIQQDAAASNKLSESMIVSRVKTEFINVSVVYT